MTVNQTFNMTERAGPSRQRTLCAAESDFQEKLEELIDEVFYDSDNDPDFEILSDHDTDSEEEDDEKEEVTIENDGSAGFFYGKNKCFKWRKQQPPNNVRTRQHNIVVQLPGLRPKAKSLGENPDVVDVWGLLFSQDILDEILLWTNMKIHNLRTQYANKSLPYLQDLDVLELKALIGLLVYTAIFKSGNESIHSLFATDGTCRDVFRYTMSKERFLFLLTALRFDNPDDREVRKQEDRAAAISKIYTKFIENSQLCFNRGISVCG